MHESSTVVQMSQPTPRLSFSDNTELASAPTPASFPGSDQVNDTLETIKPSDLDNMSVDELRQQEEMIQKAILEKQKAERKAVIDQIVDVVNRYKIPIEELVDALGGIKIKRKGVKAKLKYQDPLTGATWSGRGKEPSWIKDKDRAKFLIS